MNDYRCNILIKIDSFPVSKAIKNYTGRKENPIYNSNKKRNKPDEHYAASIRVKL